MTTQFPKEYVQVLALAKEKFKARLTEEQETVLKELECGKDGVGKTPSDR